MWLVAVNPISGQGRGAIKAQEVTNYLAAQSESYRIITGSSAINLDKNLREQAHGVRGIIAVGGDGLIHLVIQICIEFNLPLVPIPAGTGNDFVRAIGWTLEDVPPIIWRAIKSEPQEIDLGNVDGEYFGAVLSTGFDSIVNERANKISWPKGPNKYNAAIAIELPRFKPKSYKFKIDDREFEREAMLIAVGNGNSYGGGMKVCPGAQIDDGLFEIMILNPISKFEFLRVFPTVYDGKHIDHPKVEVFTGKSVQISADAIAYADGERVGPLPINATVAAKALRTWLP